VDDQIIRHHAGGLRCGQHFRHPVGVSGVGWRGNRPDQNGGVDGFHSLVVIGEILTVNRTRQGAPGRSHPPLFPTAVNLVADFPILRASRPRIGHVPGDPRLRQTDRLGMGVLGRAPVAAEVHDGLHLTAEFIHKRDVLGGRGTVTQTRDVIPVHDVGVGSARPTNVAGTGNLHGRHVGGVRPVVGTGVAGHIGSINFPGNGD
jgi:hypothetical protein